MNEKILNTKKNGLGMLLLWGILYLISIGLVIFGLDTLFISLSKLVLGK